MTDRPNRSRGSQHDDWLRDAPSALARAFALEPKLVLADEPTGNLDPDTSSEIMLLLNRINQNGTTVVMSTHNARAVDDMRKRVIELQLGKIVRDEENGVYGDVRR